jgi:hypothetical protein
MVVDGWGWGLSAATKVEMDGRTVDNRDIRRGRKLVAQRSPTFKRRKDGRRAEDGRRDCGMHGRMWRGCGMRGWGGCGMRQAAERAPRGVGRLHY